MAFSPLTEVRLLTAVPLDNTYTDTLTFNSLTSQANYFMGKQKAVAQNLTYQREEMYVRYPADYDSIIDCNYLMYKNVAMSNKYFYAFITRMEYKGEGNTWIYFEIDAYQTYMFDLQIKQCFVEREHTNNDAIGANLLDEGLALGDYVCNATTEKYFRNWWICVGSTVDLRDFSKYEGGYLYGRVYSGISYFCFDADEWTVTSALPAIMSDLAAQGKSDAIVNIFMIPKDIVNPSQQSGGYLQDPRGRTSVALPNTGALNGYVPVNKKLLTYPYRGVTMSNLAGQSVTLRYEFFGSGAYAGIQGGTQQNSKIICAPLDYRGYFSDYDESISIGNYPQCIWSKDVYSNWLASQSIRQSYTAERFITNAVANIGMGAVQTAATGNPLPLANAAMQTVGSFYDTYSKMSEEKEIFSLSPPSAKGSVGNDYTNITFGTYGFVFSDMSIKAEVARCIDNYFSMYGYKTNRVKQPNINGRASWNYVKTNGAKVIGKCPVGAIDTVKQMLDRGVTFWHGDYVGDYSRSNPIL